MGMVSRLCAGLIVAVSLTGCCWDQYYGYGAGYNCYAPVQDNCAPVQDCCGLNQGWNAPMHDPCGTCDPCGYGGYHDCCLLEPLMDLVEVLHHSFESCLWGHHGYGYCDPSGTYPGFYNGMGSDPCCTGGSSGCGPAGCYPSGLPTPIVPNQIAPNGTSSAPVPMPISQYPMPVTSF